MLHALWNQYIHHLGQHPVVQANVAHAKELQAMDPNLRSTIATSNTQAFMTQAQRGLHQLLGRGDTLTLSTEQEQVALKGLADLEQAARFYHQYAPDEGKAWLRPNLFNHIAAHLEVYLKAGNEEAQQRLATLFQHTGVTSENVDELVRLASQLELVRGTTPLPALGGVAKLGLVASLIPTGLLSGIGGVVSSAIAIPLIVAKGMQDVNNVTLSNRAACVKRVLEKTNALTVTPEHMATLLPPPPKEETQHVLERLGRWCKELYQQPQGKLGLALAGVGALAGLWIYRPKKEASPTQ